MQTLPATQKDSYFKRVVGYVLFNAEGLSLLSPPPKALSNLIPYTSDTTAQLVWEKPGVLFKNHCFTILIQQGRECANKRFLLQCE